MKLGIKAGSQLMVEAFYFPQLVWAFRWISIVGSNRLCLSTKKILLALQSIVNVS